MARSKQPADTLRVDPLVRRFFELANDHELDYSHIAYKAGVSSETIYRWQKSNVPNLVTFSACLEAMGYELTIKIR